MAIWDMLVSLMASSSSQEVQRPQHSPVLGTLVVSLLPVQYTSAQEVGAAFQLPDLSVQEHCCMLITSAGLTWRGIIVSCLDGE